MRDFKKEIFLSENGKPFSALIPLESRARDIVLDQVHKLLNVSNIGNLYQQVVKELLHYDIKDFTDELIKEVFDKSGFELKDEIFLIWNEEDIDKIEVGNFLKNLEYLWYSESDEAILFLNIKKNKILMITDYGRIYHSK